MFLKITAYCRMIYVRPFLCQHSKVIQGIFEKDGLWANKVENHCFKPTLDKTVTTEAVIPTAHILNCARLA